MKRKIERKAVTLCVCIIIGLACLAQAVPITIQIGGYITSASGSGLPSSIYEGVTFTGTYTYDSSTPDSDSDSHRGEYVHDSPYGISVVLGGYEFKTVLDQTDEFCIEIANDLLPGDQPIRDHYVVTSNDNFSVPALGSNIDWIFWSLIDETHTALSSDSLPLTEPDLTAWDYNRLEIGNLSGLLIEGTVTQVELVPEPLTITLLILGIFFSRRR